MTRYQYTLGKSYAFIGNCDEYVKFILQIFTAHNISE